MSALSVTMQAFFTQRLAQRDASPHTVAAYRDSFRLLLSYIRFGRVNWPHFGLKRQSYLAPPRASHP